MKYLFILLSLPMFCFAQDNEMDSHELLFGSVTDHFYGSGSNEFSHKLNPSGDWIANPMVGYRSVMFVDDNCYKSWTVFSGENSIGNGMLGAAFSAGIGDKTVRLGLIGGGYLQNNSQFFDKGLEVAGFPVTNSVEITPIMGFEFTYNIEITKKFYFTINNLIAPWLYTGSIGIGWRI